MTLLDVCLRRPSASEQGAKSKDASLALSPYRLAVNRRGAATGVVTRPFAVARVADRGRAGSRGREEGHVQS